MAQAGTRATGAIALYWVSQIKWLAASSREGGPMFAPK